MLNDINNENKKESMIRSLGVFELRGVARELGVPSPTTKKRDELISLILEASKNGKYIEDSIPKRGRPFKKLNVLEHITNKISPEDFKGLDFDSVVRFAQEIVPVKDKTDEKAINAIGIIRKYDCARLLDMKTNDIVFFTNNIEYFDLLETGNLIKVEAKKLAGEDKQYIATKILEINGKKAGDYIPLYPDLGKEIIDKEEFPFAEKSIKLGRRNAYKLEEAIFENQNFENLFNFCQENNCHFVTLGVNISFENNIKLREVLPDENNFTTIYGTNPDVSYNKIIDAILYAYNLSSSGENVILFVTDIIDVARCLDANFENDYEDEHAPKTKVIMQKLLAFARSYQSGVHSTVLMCYEESDLQERYLVNEILKISNKI